MTPVVDITGWVISFTVATSFGNPTKELQVTATITNGPLGMFDVIMTQAQTILINPDKYVYDLWKTNTGDQRILSVGDFNVGARAR
jgi:hypothetical protein